MLVIVDGKWRCVDLKQNAVSFNLHIRVAHGQFERFTIHRMMLASDFVHFLSNFSVGLRLSFLNNMFVMTLMWIDGFTKKCKCMFFTLQSVLCFTLMNNNNLFRKQAQKIQLNCTKYAPSYSGILADVWQSTLKMMCVCV